MIAAQYYIKRDPEESEGEYFDSENIIVFFVNAPHQEGEFYLKDIAGIKIKYNTETGVVNMVSAEQPKGIKNYYSPDAFYHVIKPIVKAICLLSKLRLLLKLSELDDKEIQSIIRRNHVAEDGKYVNITDSAIDKTIKQIRQYVKPTLFRRKKKTHLQRAIHHVLHQLQVESITCKKDVEDIIGKINEKVLNQQKTNKSFDL